MLEVAGFIVSQTDAGPRAHFKWRPHPAEHLPTVARICPPHLERSVASSFEDDLAWSDIVVANQSTTVVEAVLADRVLFLHVLPVYEDGPNAMAVAPERRFLHAVDVVDRLSKCILAIDRDGIAALLEPEREARPCLVRLPDGLSSFVRGGVTNSSGLTDSLAHIKRLCMTSAAFAHRRLSRRQHGLPRTYEAIGYVVYDNCHSTITALDGNKTLLALDYFGGPATT